MQPYAVALAAPSLDAPSSSVAKLAKLLVEVFESPERSSSEIRSWTDEYRVSASAETPVLDAEPRPQPRTND